MVKTQQIALITWFNAAHGPNAAVLQKHLLPHQRLHRLPLQSLMIGRDGQRLLAEQIGSGQDPAAFDVIHMAGWRRDHDMAAALGAYFEQCHVPFLGRTVLDLYPRTKVGEMLGLARAAVPQPMSFYVSRPQDMPALFGWAAAKTGLSMPVIVKAVDGTYGEDNFLVHDQSELAKLVLDEERHYIMQQYIPNTFDYRLIVLGGAVSAVIKRRRGDDSHLNNVTRGAAATFLPVATVPAELCTVALRAAAALRRSDISGVDLVVDEVTGKPYVLEVNKTPNLSIGATGEAGIATKMRALYGYLDRLATSKGGGDV